MSELELRFKIDAYRPETTPMERVGEYLVSLAKMLGARPDIHFEKLEAGSTCIVQRIEEEAAAAVEERISHVAQGTADAIQLAAYREVNALQPTMPPVN